MTESFPIKQISLLLIPSSITSLGQGLIKNSLTMSRKNKVSKETKVHHFYNFKVAELFWCQFH